VADDQPTDNKAKLEYEATVNEESFQRAEQRAKQSTDKTIEANKSVSREAEREARNRVRSAETETKDEVAALKNWQREQDRIRKEASTTAKSIHADESKAFNEQIKREQAQLREAAAIKKTMLQDEGKLVKDTAKSKEKLQKDETATLRNAQRERDRIQKESSSLSKRLDSDQARATADRVRREKAQLIEAAAIRRAMRQDESKRIREIADLESGVAKRRITEDRLRRENSLYSPAQMKRFRQEADKLLGMLGVGGAGPGGPPRRPPRGAGGPAGGGGYRGGGGPQINPFLTSLGFAATAVPGIPGSRLLGSAAIGQGFGGIQGLYGALAGGAIAVGLIGAIEAVKAAMARTESEQKFIGAILQVGASFDKAQLAAESFHTTLKSTREEALEVAAAFAAAGTRVQTKPGEISSISARATATGQKPEDIAKTLDAISKGSRDAFEASTGLKASITINEYAKSLGKLPAELTKVQEAQALYNKFIEQGNNYTDLATAKQTTAQGRLQAFSNSMSDFASEYGAAWVSTIQAWGAYIGGDNRAIADFGKRERERVDALVRTQQQPNLLAQLQEQQRQRELEQRYESAGKRGEIEIKRLTKEKPGETDVERLKSLIEFRGEFERITAELDRADPRLKAVSDDIEGRLAQAAGRAYNELENLRKSVRGMTGDFADLILLDENPFVKLYSDAAEAADNAYDRFRILGDEVVSQYTRMQTAAIDAQIFQVKVQTQMKATNAEFEAARLSKPFIELTGEMKRSLSVLQTEVNAAINVPKLLATGKAIDLFAASRTPRGNNRAVGLYNVSEVSGEYVAQQQFDRLMKLRRQYGATGLQSDIGGSEIKHILDQELIKLFESLPPTLQARALRAPGARGPQGFATAFGSAFKGEAAYSQDQIELALQRAAIQRDTIREAEERVKRLGSLGGGAGFQKNILRAEILAITGSVPREELTPGLLRARVDALTEEAVFQRSAQDAAIKAVQEAQALRAMLDNRLQSIEKSIKNREESVLLRVLDESDKTRVNTLGPAMNPSTLTGVGAAQ
jgi:hypothetical protein